MDSIINRESVTCSLTITVHCNLNKSLYARCAAWPPPPLAPHVCFPDGTQLFPWQHRPVCLAPSVDLQKRSCVTVRTVATVGCHLAAQMASFLQGAARGAEGTNDNVFDKEYKNHLGTVFFFFTLSLSVTSDRDYADFCPKVLVLMVLVVRSSRLQVQKLLKCLFVPLLFAFLVLFLTPCTVFICSFHSSSVLT